MNDTAHERIETLVTKDVATSIPNTDLRVTYKGDEQLAHIVVTGEYGIIDQQMITPAGTTLTDDSGFLIRPYRRATGNGNTVTVFVEVSIVPMGDVAAVTVKELVE